MKIINAKIENNLLIIELDSVAGVTKVYLDGILSKTYHSSNDADHEIIISSPQISDNSININIEEYDATSFIVTVVGSETAHAIAYDEKNLYYQKVNTLVSFCYTCLDKHQKEKILML